MAPFALSRVYRETLRGEKRERDPGELLERKEREALKLMKIFDATKSGKKLKAENFTTLASELL